MVSTHVSARSLVRNGLLMGLAGGLAEVGVVGSYMALTGGNTVVVGRGISAAVGLSEASAWMGLAIHMGLAASLGAGLSFVFSAVRSRHVPRQAGPVHARKPGYSLGNQLLRGTAVAEPCFRAHPAL